MPLVTSDADRAGEVSVALVWTFEAPQPGFVVGDPVVSSEAVYLSVGHPLGFHQRGAVYAIDPATGQSKWIYDHDGAMLHTASTPLRSNGRLFVGEGLHNNFSCRLHCIDAHTGKGELDLLHRRSHRRWTGLAGDCVIFPPVTMGFTRWMRSRQPVRGTSTLAAHRFDPLRGERSSLRWQRPEPGLDTLQVICLETATGKPVWRTPVNLPAWGSPVVAGGRVFVGLGNGQLTQA